MKRDKVDTLSLHKHSLVTRFKIYSIFLHLLTSITKPQYKKAVTDPVRGGLYDRGREFLRLDFIMWEFNRLKNVMKI